MKRTCLTERERYIIEYELKQGHAVKDIAHSLNRATSCIYAEIKRGTVKQIDSELTEYSVYLADVGQAAHVRNCQTRGVGLKIGNDLQLANFLENLILHEGYSPYAALQIAAGSGYNVTFGLSTLYNYIRGGVFQKLGRKHLHKHKTNSTQKRQAKKKYNKNVKSIEQRAKHIKNRKTFGHWEMDTVVGKQGTTDCLLVLTERKSRYEIIRKMAHKSAECTQVELDKLEKEYGELFRKIFKTVTCDNGSEFYGGGVIDKSIHGGRRFKLYYCHPYRSNERASNENQNRFIRRFVHKGTDIANVSQAEVTYIQDYINKYPRKLFNGKSAEDIWRIETGFS